RRSHPGGLAFCGLLTHLQDLPSSPPHTRKPIMPDANNADFPSLLEAAVKFAKTAGADAADAVIGRNLSLSVGERLGKLEKLTRSEDQEMGLRVFVGKRQAIVSTSDFTRTAIEELANRAVAMARVVPEDPFCGLADAA